MGIYTIINIMRSHNCARYACMHQRTDILAVCIVDSCVASTLIMGSVRTMLCAGSSAPLSSLHALFVRAFGDAVCNVCSWLNRGR
jgi:hypothetical protein